METIFVVTVVFLLLGGGGYHGFRRYVGLVLVGFSALSWSLFS